MNGSIKKGLGCMIRTICEFACEGRVKLYRGTVNGHFADMSVDGEIVERDV